MEYTIDQLARVAETTVRSVRVYHERGLLPSPDVRGRIGYYGADHLNRLQTISRLLNRGMKLNGIRELLEAWDRGDGLADVLGVSPEPEPPAKPIPVVDVPELPEELRRAVAESNDPIERYRLVNPRCGDLAARLMDAGLPATTAIGLIEQLRADCARIEDRFGPQILHLLAGHRYAQSSRTPRDRAAYESDAAIARLLTTRAATELFDQALARHISVRPD
ncbi:MerR family transcriptional regulator [Nocardia tengchongensis]|uniref:MerR family transcriptional regulator n=1 Tax=Nocardia tengchongensis TaxID=2055889 RepID=UPI0036B5B797